MVTRGCGFQNGINCWTGLSDGSIDCLAHRLTVEDKNTEGKVIMDDHGVRGRCPQTKGATIRIAGEGLECFLLRKRGEIKMATKTWWK